jgi:PAS domain-containing protein
MGEVLNRIIELVKGLPWDRIKNFLQLLVMQQPLALLVCVCLLATSLGLGYWYWDRSTNYENIFRDTLQANLESTPQNFKGLEAFIMSNVVPGVNTDLEKEEIHQKFHDLCVKLESQVSKFNYDNNDELGLQVAIGSNDGKILTDYHENGFLFLPITILRNTLSESDQETLASKEQVDRDKHYEIIAKALKDDKVLKRDIAFTKSLAYILQEYTAVQIAVQKKDNLATTYLEEFPTQSYIITKNGINRIFSQKPNAADFYGSQFSATTFFPNRPYFWAAFQDKKHFGDPASLTPKEKQTIGDYFYVTRPYMDLGGNGIVITLVRGLVIDGLIQAAICFDLPFKQGKSIQEALISRIETFEAVKVKAKCTIPKGAGKGQHDCFPHTDEGNSIQQEKRELIGVMKSFITKKTRAEVFGNIQVISSEEDNVAGNTLEISVPVAEPISIDEIIKDLQTGTVLLFKLNLFDYKRKTTFIALAAATAFGLMTLFLAYLWGSTIRRKREYEEAFDRVATVMYWSPTPYVRLNSKDQICDLSLSFCTMLGYNTQEQSIKNLKSFKLEELLADKTSRQEYRRVQKLREEGGLVDPYPLKLKRCDGSLVSVTVVSADVPSTERDTLPETFGIFLDDSEVIIHGDPPGINEGLEEGRDKVISLLKGNR